MITVLRRSADNILKKFSKYFFEFSLPLELGIYRFIFFGFIFFIYVNTDFSALGNVPLSIWFPTFLFKHLPVPIFSSSTIWILGFTWKCTLLTSSIGLFTRTSTALSFILGVYLIGILNSFGKESHTECLMLIVFSVLALSRCGDSFSIDSILRDKFRIFKSKKEVIEGEYTWPKKLIRILLTFVFCSAGFSKLRNSGFDWVTSDYLTNLMVSKSFNVGRIDPVINWIPFWIAERPVFGNILAGFTIIIEIIAPLALVNRYLLLLIIPSLFLLQAGFWLILGIPFPQMMSVFVFFIPFSLLYSKYSHLNRN